MNTTNVSVYQHRKRPEWGMALLAWERDAKRAYLFEDGTMRVIAEPFYDLLTLIPVEDGALPESFSRQIGKMNASAAQGLLGQRKRSDLGFTVEEQARLFMAQFANGFAGEAWRTERRGDGVKKPLKRHRSAVVERAQTDLGKQGIDAALMEHSHRSLWEQICGLLSSTDLVPPRDVKALRARLDGVSRAHTLALKELLYPESAEAEPFALRFSTFVGQLKELLGRAPSWPLVTSFLAVFAPSEHVCIHATSVRQQSKWMGRRPIGGSKPNAADYERALAVVRELSEQLTQLGLGPADLLDVYDFVRLCTTPSAKKRLLALRESPASVPTESESLPAQGATSDAQPGTAAHDTQGESASNDDGEEREAA